LGGKIIDEIYTAKIQPIVKRVLGTSDQKLGNANGKSKKRYGLAARSKSSSRREEALNIVQFPRKGMRHSLSSGN
jgi:hypothetical protein